MAQLPAGSEGAAAGVLFYALVCLFCNLLLLWLLWTSKEKGSCKSRVYYMLTMTSPLSKEKLALKSAAGRLMFTADVPLKISSG